MKIPGLSEGLIKEKAEDGSVRRGREYFESGAVKSLRRRSDHEIEAFVQGTDVAPYRVTIDHEGTKITSAECTCPYVTGAWCRHIVAALYAVIESEGTLSRPLEEMLVEFDRTELIRLLERIVADQPGAAAVVEDAFRQKEQG